MHVGILQAYFARPEPGGGEVATEHLARALQRRGHRVSIFTDAPGTYRDGIDDLEVTTYRTPAKLNPINELTLGRRAFDDLAACDVALCTDESGFVGLQIPVPAAMVFHLVWHGWIDRHGTVQTLRGKPQAYVYRWIETQMARRADAIVAISSNMREDIGRIGEFGDKTVDVPNGVDVDRFAPTDDSTDRFTVHFQGRLVGMKNPDALIRARAAATEDWRVTIGGDGPLRDSLKALAQSLGVADDVEFLGYVPDADLPARYARSDLYVLPSTYEGMPLTVLEAAASGTPVLASPRAATEFVTDDIGRVVDPTPAALAETIDELARSTDQVAELGAAARTKAEAYSWDSVAEQYEELFETLRSEH